MKNLRSTTRPRSHRRSFFISFAVSLSISLLVVGLLVADYNCRSTALGDTQPTFSVTRAPQGTATLQVHAMGIDTFVDISAGIKAWDFLLEFFCLPAPTEDPPQ